MSAEWINVSTNEDCGFWAMGRALANDDGLPFQQADVNSISYAVYKDGEETTASTALTVANVVSDTLVTNDERWTEDESGYNFIVNMPDSLFPNPGTYEVIITFTPASGNKSKLKYRVNVDGDLSS